MHPITSHDPALAVPSYSESSTPPSPDTVLTRDVREGKMETCLRQHYRTDQAFFEAVKNISSVWRQNYLLNHCSSLHRWLGLNEERTRHPEALRWFIAHVPDMPAPEGIQSLKEKAQRVLADTEQASRPPSPRASGSTLERLATRTKQRAMVGASSSRSPSPVAFGSTPELPIKKFDQSDSVLIQKLDDRTLDFAQLALHLEEETTEDPLEEHETAALVKALPAIMARTSPAHIDMACVINWCHILKRLNADTGPHTADLLKHTTDLLQNDSVTGSIAHHVARIVPAVRTQFSNEVDRIYQAMADDAAVCLSTLGLTGMQSGQRLTRAQHTELDQKPLKWCEMPHAKGKRLFTNRHIVALLSMLKEAGTNLAGPGRQLMDAVQVHGEVRLCMLQKYANHEIERQREKPLSLVLHMRRKSWLNMMQMRDCLHALSGHTDCDDLFDILAGYIPFLEQANTNAKLDLPPDLLLAEALHALHPHAGKQPAQELIGRLYDATSKTRLAGHVLQDTQARDAEIARLLMVAKRIESMQGETRLYLHDLSYPLATWSVTRALRALRDGDASDALQIILGKEETDVANREAMRDLVQDILRQPEFTGMSARTSDDNSGQVMVRRDTARLADMSRETTPADPDPGFTNPLVQSAEETTTNVLEEREAAASQPPSVSASGPPIELLVARSSQGDSALIRKLADPALDFTQLASHLADEKSAERLTEHEASALAMALPAILERTPVPDISTKCMANWCAVLPRLNTGQHTAGLLKATANLLQNVNMMGAIALHVAGIAPAVRNQFATEVVRIYQSLADNATGRLTLLKIPDIQPGKRLTDPQLAELGQKGVTWYKTKGAHLYTKGSIVPIICMLKEAGSSPATRQLTDAVQVHAEARLCFLRKYANQGETWNQSSSIRDIGYKSWLHTIELRDCLHALSGHTDCGDLLDILAGYIPFLEQANTNAKLDLPPDLMLAEALHALHPHAGKQPAQELIGRLAYPFYAAFRLFFPLPSAAQFLLRGGAALMASRQRA